MTYPLDIKSSFCLFTDSKIHLCKISIKLGRKVFQIVEMLKLAYTAKSLVGGGKLRLSSIFELFNGIAQQSKWRCHCSFSNRSKKDKGTQIGAYYSLFVVFVIVKPNVGFISIKLFFSLLILEQKRLK